MAVITRTFPVAKRGSAMALWGTTAGVATLIGPILGGILVDTAGWEWIFFVNVPVGAVGFVLAWRLVPTLQTHSHSFDWVGVVMSAVGMFLLTFGIQEGENYGWGRILGWITVPMLIGTGLMVLALFLVWQGRIRREPLVPLALFGDRNFSLSTAGIACTSLAAAATFLPFTFYAQAARGWSPTAAALLAVVFLATVTSDAFAVARPPEAVRLALGAAVSRSTLGEGLRIIADLLQQSPAMSSVVV